MRNLYQLIALICLALLLVGCQKTSTPGGKLRIVCTTSMIGDTVRTLAQDRAEVVVLMGPGVDPHLYKASTSDVTTLRGAQVIFYNGLHLEGKMQEVLQTLARGQQTVVAVGDKLDPKLLLWPSGESGPPDPHIWFDVELWRQVSQQITATLVEADPQGANLYTAQGKKYDQQLEELHDWCQLQASQLPKPRRITVTSHDAFSYFGRAYGFEVVGLQGISTTSEAGIRDVTQLVDFLKKNKVPAIFVESSVSRAAIERVAKDAGVKIGGELYSDSMGPAGSPEGTYLGMIRHNMQTVVSALK